MWNTKRSLTTILVLNCLLCIANGLIFGGSRDEESTGYGLVSGAGRIIEGVLGAVIDVKKPRTYRESEKDTVVVVNQPAPQPQPQPIVYPPVTYPQPYGYGQPYPYVYGQPAYPGYPGYPMVAGAQPSYVVAGQPQVMSADLGQDNGIHSKGPHSQLNSIPKWDSFSKEQHKGYPPYENNQKGSNGHYPSYPNAHAKIPPFDGNVPWPSHPSNQQPKGDLPWPSHPSNQQPKGHLPWPPYPSNQQQKEVSPFHNQPEFYPPL